MTIKKILLIIAVLYAVQTAIAGLSLADNVQSISDQRIDQIENLTK